MSDGAAAEARERQAKAAETRAQTGASRGTGDLERVQRRAREKAKCLKDPSSAASASAAPTPATQLFQEPGRESKSEASTPGVTAPRAEASALSEGFAAEPREQRAQAA